MTLAISLLLFSGLSQAQQGGTLKGKVIDKNEKFPLTHRQGVDQRHKKIWRNQR